MSDCNNCGGSTESPCKDKQCGCVKDYPATCVRYYGDVLPCTNIDADGMNLKELLLQYDDYFCTLKDEIVNFIGVKNIGLGAQLYKGDDLLGRKEFRTLLPGTSELLIDENSDNITFTITTASETQRGTIEIATQTEVNTGNDTERAVTPHTLANYVSTVIPTINDASTTQKGIIEIATQGETNTGSSMTLAVTPGTLSTYVTAQINAIPPDPPLPDATISQKGIIEIATQPEVDGGSDTQRAVVPSTLSTYVADQISLIPSVADASTTQKGVIEIATQPEVDLGVDAVRAVVPSTLATYVADQIALIPSTTFPSATETEKGVAEIATQGEVNAGLDDERFITSLKLQNKINAIPPSTISKYQEIVVTSWSQYVPQQISHSLGEIPRIVAVSLRCNSSAYGYSVGDETSPDLHLQSRPDSPQAFGISVQRSSANIKFKVAHAFSIPTNIMTNDGGASRTDVSGSSDTGNFRLVFRLYA